MEPKVGAALVIGGGIAGIQASLDLANAGIKVYLLENSAAIGGRMAQLDKTFPTNDCAMCIVSPKLVETGRHLNIEILTDSELLVPGRRSRPFYGPGSPPSPVCGHGEVHRVRRLRGGLPDRTGKRIQRRAG